MRQSPLQNKVVLLTGAFSGIGEALVPLLMQAKAKVVAVGRNDHKRLPSYTGNFLPIVRDLHSPLDAEETVEFAVEKFGQVDALIHCAGSLTPLAFGQPIKASLERNLQDNFYTALHLILQLLPRFKKQEGGLFVVPSCDLPDDRYKLLGGFLASQQALDGFLKGLSAELMSAHTRLERVSLPPVHSRFWRRLPEEHQPAQKGRPKQAAELLFQAAAGVQQVPLRQRG